MAFYTLVLAQLLNVFNMPKRKESFFFNEVTKNPWVWGALALSLLLTYSAYTLSFMAEALAFITLSTGQLVSALCFALGALALAQLIKRMTNI
jgi:Ca2+-transporting ATPase